MRIKEYEKPNTATLHATGVKAALCEWLIEHCKHTNSTKAHWINQALAELKKSIEAKQKQAEKANSAAA